MIDRERARPLAGRRRGGEAPALRLAARLAHERQELGHRREERSGRDETAVLLDHQAELLEAQLEAALPLGHVDRGPAELARTLPGLLGAARVLDHVAHQRGGALALQHGPHRVDQLLLFRGDLEIHLRPASPGPGRGLNAQHAPRHEQHLALVSLELGRDRDAGRERRHGGEVEHRGRRLMKRRGSVSGSSSPEATPSSINPWSHSTSVAPASTIGEATPGCALAASRRIRRATVGRSRGVGGLGRVGALGRLGAQSDCHSTDPQVS